MAPDAKHGVGAAVITFHSPSMVCWRFAHLHGFTDATSARVDVATVGRAGKTVIVLSPGPRLRHQRCVTVNPAFSRKIVARPGGYYVSIESKAVPAWGGPRTALTLARRERTRGGKESTPGGRRGVARP